MFKIYLNMDINTPEKYKINWKKLKDSLVSGWDDLIS